MRSACNIVSAGQRRPHSRGHPYRMKRVHTASHYPGGAEVSLVGLFTPMIQSYFARVLLCVCCWLQSINLLPVLSCLCQSPSLSCWCLSLFLLVMFDCYKAVICWHPRRNLHSYLQEAIENFLFLPGVWLHMASFLCDNCNAPAFL